MNKDEAPTDVIRSLTEARRIDFGVDGYQCVINGRRVRLTRWTENPDGSLTIEGLDEDGPCLAESVTAEALLVSEGP